MKSITRMSARCATLILLAVLAATPATAADHGFSLSLKWGEGDVDFQPPVVPIAAPFAGDDDVRAFELGWRKSDLIGIQAGYHDLDGASVTVPCPSFVICITIFPPPDVTLHVDTEAYTLAFVPQLALTKSLSIFAKGGIVAWDSEVRAGLGSEAVSRASDEEFAYGAGLRLQLLERFSAFYEYESLGELADVQSLGLTFHF